MQMKEQKISMNSDNSNEDLFVITESIHKLANKCQDMQEINHGINITCDGEQQKNKQKRIQKYRRIQNEIKKLITEEK